MLIKSNCNPGCKLVSNSMPKIKEDLKREILAYLVHSVRDNKPLENITYSGILDEIDEAPEKIDKAIDELEEDKDITSHDVTLKIYLPTTEDGKDIIKRLAEEEALPYSPYWLMVFSLLIFWVALPYLNLQIPSESVGTTILSAYLGGIKNAIIYSAIVGAVGAQLLKNVFMKKKKIEVLSPILYRNMNDVVKYTIALSVLGAIVYNVLKQDYGFQLTDAALKYFLASLGIALTYVLSRKKRDQRAEDGSQA